MGIAPTCFNISMATIFDRMLLQCKTLDHLITMRFDAPAPAQKPAKYVNAALEAFI
jgi:hypothetical protein